MSFVPVVERAVLGKRIIAQQDCRDLLYHNETVTSTVRHTGKKVIGIPKPFRLSDDISHDRSAAVDNADIFRDPRAVEEPKKRFRSQTSMDEKIEYQPLDYKADKNATKFSQLPCTLRFGAQNQRQTFHPGLRLAPLAPPPPPQNEVPGFHGMGNPILVVPNERPNQAAATKTNALAKLPFFGERKNNIWSVYSE